MPQVTESHDKNIFIAYGIWLLTSQHALIRQLKKITAPSHHGDKHWNSSYLVMDYFRENPVKKKSRVLDVGCGWGPVSIYMAECGYKVTGLDVDEDVFEYLDVQAALNDVEIKNRVGDMKSMRQRDLAEFDVIVGGDICFWDELGEDWFKMLKRAAKAGVKKVVLADPGRPPFYDLIDKCEAIWDTEFLEWYALEPKHFQGYLMVVDLQS